MISKYISRKCLAVLLFIFAIMTSASAQEHKKTPWIKVDHSEQQWFKKTCQNHPNYNEVKKLYDTYFDSQPLEKSTQRNMVRRWLSIYQDYTDQNGLVSIKQASKEDYQKIKNAEKVALKKYEKAKGSELLNRSPPNDTWNDSTGTWRMIGPYHSRYVSGVFSMFGGFNDRVYINPHNPKNMFAGQSYGGLWVSQDGGNTWDLTDSEFPNGKNGYSNRDNYYGEIKAHPLDMNKIIAGTEAGLLMSNNSGDSWELANTLNIMDTPGERAYYVAPNPQDLNSLLCTYGRKLYESNDNGNTWTVIYDNSAGGSNYHQGQHNTIGIYQRGYNFFGLDYHPTDGKIIYLGLRNSTNEACIYRSKDGGNSFNLLVNTGKTNRVKLIVSQADEEHIYVADFYTSVSNPGADEGIYKYDTTGVLDQFIAHQGGQGALLDDISVDAKDADTWYYGGYASGEVWLTENQGTTWTTNNPGYVNHNNYVHSDVRAISVVGDTALIGTDGGLHITRDGGLTFQAAGDWISGIDQWGFSSAYKGEILASGDDHGPTETRTSDTDRSWAGIGGADSGEVQVNQCNTDFMYGRDVYSRFLAKRTSDTTYSRMANVIVDAKYEYLAQDPNEYYKFYPINGADLMISEDNMASASLIKTFPTTLTRAVIPIDNNQILYVLEDKKVVNKSMDGGITWSIITPSSAVTNNQTTISDITTDESGDNIWLSYGGTQTNCKAVHSNDGGQSWINLTTAALPNFNAGDITYQRGTNGTVYLATDGGGIWYRSTSDSDWSILGSGLPSMGYVRTIYTVPDLSKFRMGTARGSFEHDLPVTSGLKAHLAVGSRNASNCKLDTVQFFDYSSYFDDGSISFQWTFEGATIEQSTDMNPKVVYECAGIFDVTLTITNGSGDTDTKIMEDFMLIDIENCNIATSPTYTSTNTNNNSYVEAPAVELENIPAFTWTAWVKGEGVQRAYAGILSHNTTTGGIHLNLRAMGQDSTEIGYHHPNGQWWWSSGHYLIPDEWTHLAFVVEPTGMTIYKNGIPSKHNRTVSSMTFDKRFLISSMESRTGDRCFKGDIDEVAFYNKALTKQEIREIRHLTKKNPQYPVLTDDHLVRYYQFNIEGNIVLDYSGKGRNGELVGSISKKPSTGPYGGGTSSTLDISASGSYDFLDPGITAQFGPGVVPNGPVVVSHIESQPNLAPNAQEYHENGYYILNNYGTNTSFASLTSIAFYKTGTIGTLVAQNNNGFNIHTRQENSYINNYSLSVGTTDISLNAGSPGIVTAIDASSITSSSQFVITRDKYPLSTPKIQFVSPDLSNQSIEGGESMSFLFDSNNQGMLLPVLSDYELNALGQPTNGMMAYSSSEQSIIIFQEGIWNISKADGLINLLATNASSGTTSIGIPEILPIDSSAIFALRKPGFIKFVSISNNGLKNINYPVPGMLIYNSDVGRVQYFDGSYWIDFSTTASSLPTSTGTPVVTEGIHNGYTKEDNVLVQDNEIEGAIMIPTLSADNIQNPSEGLFIYDTTLKSFLFYNGLGWNKIK